jgi:4-amino-4-deoxy-L-arabinose transferase-like glycosyltransferase
MAATDSTIIRRARTLGRPLKSVPLPVLLLAGLVVARLALATWWLAVDEGIVDTESGRHLQRAWDNYVLMDTDLLAAFRQSTDYPPMLYLIGALGAAVGGLSADSLVAAQDVFLVPALAVGCYGAASVAYGRTAGLLAAGFALAAPMAVSVFHMFLIDTTEAAMVALTLWAILASQRFSRVGVSALAGIAFGLGMLSKQNFPVFIVGLIAVVLLRGGWRHWRGLLAFAAIAALLSASWYWSEIERTFDLIRGASASTSGTGTETAGAPVADRWSTKSFGYYVWSTVNISVLLPLTLISISGGVALLVRWVRTRANGDLTPELVAGGLFAYFAVTYVSLKDPRYALPALAYLAVLGGGGIVLLRGRLRTVAIAVFAAVAAVTVAGTVADSGGATRLTLPGAPRSSLGERQFTLYAPGGWIAGRPDTSGAVRSVLTRAKRDGIKAVAFDPGAVQPNFNHPGLDIASREVGLALAIPYDEDSSRNALLAIHHPARGVPVPCARMRDGTGVYLSKGPLVAFEGRDFYCPSP